MKYIIHVKAEDYLEVEANDREAAHDQAKDVAVFIAKTMDWDTEIVSEHE